MSSRPAPSASQPAPALGPPCWPRVGWGWAVALLLWPSLVAAHALAPVRVDLREGSGGDVSVIWWSSPGRGAAAADGKPLRVRLPPRCLPSSQARSEVGSGARPPEFTRGELYQARFSCGPDGLSAATVSIDGLRHSELPVVLRYSVNGSPARVWTLAGNRDRVQLSRAGSVEALPAYIWLGARHVAGGIDHLAFLLCLLFMAGSVRSLAIWVSAFTLGHSASLCLSALDLVQVPTAPVEACIALSVLLLAARLRTEGPGYPRESGAARPAASGMALTVVLFGLLHGLGFASALGEAGLPAQGAVWALFGFNIGVELGQLAFIFGAALLMAALRRLPMPAALSPASARRVCLEGMGVAAGFWLIARVSQFA